VKAGMVEPGYVYGASRWTPIQLQKPYLNHGFIFKIHLKGHCLIFLSAIYQLFIEYFNIK